MTEVKRKESKKTKLLKLTSSHSKLSYLTLFDTLESLKQFSFILETNSLSPTEYLILYHKLIDEFVVFTYLIKTLLDNPSISISESQIYNIIYSMRMRSFIKVYLLPIISKFILLKTPSKLRELLDYQISLLTNIDYPLVEYFARAFSFEKYEDNLNSIEDLKVPISYKVNNTIRLIQIYNNCLETYKENNEKEKFKEMKSIAYIIIDNLNNICKICKSDSNQKYFVNFLLNGIICNYHKKNVQFIIDWIIMGMPAEMVLINCEKVVFQILYIYKNDISMKKMIFCLFERLVIKKRDSPTPNKQQDLFNVETFTSLMNSVLAFMDEIKEIQYNELNRILTGIISMLSFIQDYKPSQFDYCYYYEMFIRYFEKFIIETKYNNMPNSNKNSKKRNSISYEIKDFNDITLLCELKLQKEHIQTYDQLLKIVLKYPLKIFNNQALINITKYFDEANLVKYNTMLLNYISESNEQINSNIKLTIIIDIMKNMYCIDSDFNDQTVQIQNAISKIINSIYDSNIENTFSLFMSIKTVFQNSDQLLFKSCLIPYLSSLVVFLREVGQSFAYQQKLTNYLPKRHYNITSYTSESIFLFLKNLITTLRNHIELDFIDYAELTTTYLIDCIEIINSFAFEQERFEELNWDLICVFRKLIETEISDLECKVDLIKKFIGVLSIIHSLSFEHYQEIILFVSDELKKKILKRESSAIIVFLSTELFDRENYGYLDKERIKKNILFAEKEFLLSRKNDLTFIMEVLKKKIYYYFKNEGIFNSEDIYDLTKKIEDVWGNKFDSSKDLLEQKNEINKIILNFEKQKALNSNKPIASFVI